MVWTFGEVVVTAMFLSVVIFIGIFGNILVIIVSVKRSGVRTRGRALIASMALADSLESLNMIFMLTTVSSFGKWIFGDVLCQLHGFVTTEFIIASMYSLMTVSINRYVMVVKPSYYKKIFSKRNLILMITFIWTFPLWFAIPPLVGWSAFEFQPNKATCIFVFSTSVSYSVTLIVFCVPLPLSVIIYTCYKVFQQVRHHSMRVQNMHSATTLNVEEIKITKTLVVIIMAYLICFIPAATVNLMEMLIPKYKIPFWIDILSMLLLFANHANNPLIYGVLNRQYRRAFKALLLGLFPTKWYHKEESIAEHRGGAVSRAITAAENNFAPLTADQQFNLRLTSPVDTVPGSSTASSIGR